MIDDGVVLLKCVDMLLYIILNTPRQVVKMSKGGFLLIFAEIKK